MTTIHVAHSPDSDDAFMFYALASGKIDTEGLTYVHELQDIETLNQRARRGELEVTAVSIHAYAYIADQYALLPHGASMGDRYGPRLVSKTTATRADVKGKRIAIPGPLTSAYLQLRMYEPDFETVHTPFDEIMGAVERGEVDMGLLIHEGQGLTYSRDQPAFTWWQTWVSGGSEETAGCPFPSAATSLEKTLAPTLRTRFPCAIYAPV